MLWPFRRRDDVDAQLDLTRQALAESERQYRLLAENSSDFVARHTADGRFLYASPAAKNMVSYDPEELIGRLLWEFVHPEDTKLVSEAFAGSRPEDLRRAEFRFRAKGGTDVWLESSVRVIRDEASGNPLEIHVSHRDATERKRLEAELRALADQDPLTGLRNRRNFIDELERELASIERYGGEATLLLIDADGLKGTNDTYGHPAGDALLKGIAATLDARLRESDLIARIGGDEFAAMLRNTTPDVGFKVAESIILALRTHALELERVTLAGIGVSIGVAGAGPDSGQSADDLIARADRALYEAKRAEEKVVAANP